MSIHKPHLDEPKSSPSDSAGGDDRMSEYGIIDDLRTTSIFSSLSTLFQSGKWSDMTIRCGGREFKAHRAIVCTQSSFFDKALTSGFCETTTGVIDLPEDDPDVLERFLEFLYRGNYDVWTHGSQPAETSMMEPEEVADLLQDAPGTMDTSVSEPASDYPLTLDGEELFVAFEPDIEYNDDHEPSEAGSNVTESPAVGCSLRGIDGQTTSDDIKALHNRPSRFLTPMRLYFMADKFDVPALRLLARDRFYRVAEMSWRHANCFPDVVDELYSCTPDTDVALREIVCRLVGTAIKGDIEQRERMEPVMRKHGEFAVGVMTFMLLYESMVWT